MRTRFMLIRVITAAVLFMVLAQANIWADTQTHLILAVGYRAFLLAAPLFMYFGIANGMRLSLMVGAVALSASMISFNYFTVGLFALSMAISGYISKYVNSTSSRGAADNKVSLNVGSVLAGLLVMLTTDKHLLLGLSTAGIIFSVYLACKIQWSEVIAQEEGSHQKAAPSKRRALPMIGWALIGIATGIKLTGIFTILPQYLIHQKGLLPSWFGAMIVVNSLGVIFFQHRILDFLDRSHSNMTLIFSLSAMALLACPAILHVEHLTLAVIWICLLTLGECALSRYDKLAKDEGYLLHKEIMVGAGSFLTVALSRHFGEHIYLSGMIGFICLSLGIVLVTMPIKKVIKSYTYKCITNMHAIVLRL